MSALTRSGCSFGLDISRYASDASSSSTRATTWSKLGSQDAVTPQSSVATYTSTIASIEKQSEHRQMQGTWTVPNRPSLCSEKVGRRQAPASLHGTVLAVTRDAQPATSKQFAALFPSTRRIIIHHDDTAPDGNTTLRMDTCGELPSGGQVATTLFYMRMHDLRKRDFSLLRYSRESGREVWSSSTNRRLAARVANHGETDAGFKVSFGSFVASFKPKAGEAVDRPGSRRRDVEIESAGEHASASMADKEKVCCTAATVHMEFTNYARLKVKRKVDFRGEVRYAFEYWGVKYEWRQKGRTSDEFAKVEYGLFQKGCKDCAAQMMPLPQTRVEAEEEGGFGGWVPPYVMWIADRAIAVGASDVAEAVVGAGLVALVDDCIRRRFDA